MLAWCYSMCILINDDVMKIMLPVSYTKTSRNVFLQTFSPEKMKVCLECFLFFPPVVVSLQLSTSYPMIYMFFFSSFDICLTFRTWEYKVLALEMETHLFSQPLNLSGIHFYYHPHFHHLSLNPTRQHQKTA